jgi:hypothetical protein
MAIAVLALASCAYQPLDRTEHSPGAVAAGVFDAAVDTVFWWTFWH